MNQDEVREVIGTTVYSQDDEKIGTVGQVYLDDESGRPEFLTVNTGLFGTNESFVPVSGASVSPDRVVVPFSKDKVKNAPNVDLEGDGHLDEAYERELYDYYGTGTGLGDESVAGAAGGPGVAGTGPAPTAGDGVTGTGTEGRDVSGPETDQAMTRSEERLDVTTARQERGRARLRKYVTTEEETVTVPVRKERAVLETEPVTDANRDAARSGADISEEEHEVVLNEERVVVDKTAEPVERVRLGTETVQEEETVTEQVRKEHIEAEGDLDDRRGGV